ncbi:hypothetical protein Tco_0630995, partial [Tanacetum coccineum]
ALRRRRKLKHGALKLYVGNGMRVVVQAIVSFDLVIPNGLVIVLDNWHYAPSITRGVVSLSRLVDNGYMYTFMNYGIIVMKDGVFYFNANPRDGIYEIDVHNLYPNVSSIYNVNNKRAKRALDYLWHCRLESFSGYGLESAARILNMVPTKKVDKTPYEIWNGKAPNLSYLKETMGYYFYNPYENKIFVARYAEFFENSLTLQEASGSIVTSENFSNSE